MNPETKFKLKVQKDLKTLDKIWFVKTQEVTIRGVPDFIICLCGLFIAIEIKKDKKSLPTKLQIYNANKIMEAVGRFYFSHPGNWGEVFLELKKIERAQTALTLSALPQHKGDLS